MPKISVIIPVYNVENYIHKCINSILNQTFSDFELILIDDGSPDNCGKLCDEFAEYDKRIHVIHQKNSGQAVARNVGIEYVLQKKDSEYIIFIDSDDWVINTYLEILYKNAINMNTEISACDHFLSNSTHKRNDENNTIIITPEDFYFKHPGLADSPVCKLLKTNLLENIRFPSGKIFEDAFTIYKILFNVKKIAFTDQELYCYNQDNISTTRSDWTPHWLSQIEANEKHLSFFKSNNYKNAYKIEFHRYLKNIFYQIWHIKNTYKKNDKNEYLKILKKKMRKNILKYKISFGLPINENIGLYECAYPNLIKIYLYMNKKGLIK